MIVSSRIPWNHSACSGVQIVAAVLQLLALKKAHAQAVSVSQFKLALAYQWCNDLEASPSAPNFKNVACTDVPLLC
jgi:hypothetical protein